MPRVKGLNNSSVCLQQVLVGAASSPKLCSLALHTHSYSKSSGNTNIYLMGWMNAAYYKDAARSGIAAGEVSQGPQSYSWRVQCHWHRGGQGREGWQHRILSTAQWSSGNGKAANQQEGLGHFPGTRAEADTPTTGLRQGLGGPGLGFYGTLTQRCGEVLGEPC